MTMLPAGSNWSREAPRGRLALAHVARSGARIGIPGCDLVRPTESVYERLRLAEGRWSFDSDATSRTNPLGELDEVLWSAVRRAIVLGRSLVVAVPRVEPGISLGPAISLAVGLLLDKAGALAHTDRVPLVPGDRIAIAGRSLTTRHLLAESVLRFNQIPTPLCAFPTARLTRKGRLDRGAYGRVLAAHRQKEIKENVELMIYDLGPLTDTDDVPSTRIILAEIQEHDNRETVDRLRVFATRAGACSTIAFVNELDLDRIADLRSSGFGVLALRSSTYEGLAPVPTLAALDHSAPISTKYSVTLIEESTLAARALAAAHFRLCEALSACDNSGPRFLRQAWAVLDTLSALPTSIAAYERARRETGRSRLLSEIELLRTPRVIQGEERIAGILRVGWTHVVDALLNAYEVLSAANPLAEKIMERIIYEDGDLVVAVGEKAARDALFAELVIEYGWDGDAVTLEHLARLSRARTVSRNILTIGVDGTRRSDTSLWSMLPERVETFVYPHAARRQLRWIERCNAQLSEILPISNRQTAAAFWGERSVTATIRTTGEIAADVPRPDLEPLRRSLLADDARSWVTVRETAPNGWRIDVEDDLLRDDPDEVADGHADEGSIAGGVRVVFTDGHERIFPRTGEVLVLEGDDVVPRAVATLREGDNVLYLSGSEHRSAFEAIRERTAHLIDVDDRVLNRWRTTLTAARMRYDPFSSAARDRFVADAVRAGTDKGWPAITSWLTGLVMAPRDRDDIAIVLRLGGFGGDAGELARRVHREVTGVRTFYRQLGHRIRARLAERQTKPRDAVTTAIDEFLEDTEQRQVRTVTVLD